MTTTLQEIVCLFCIFIGIENILNIPPINQNDIQDHVIEPIQSQDGVQSEIWSNAKLWTLWRKFRLLLQNFMCPRLQSLVMYVCSYKLEKNQSAMSS